MEKSIHDKEQYQKQKHVEGGICDIFKGLLFGE